MYIKRQALLRKKAGSFFFWGIRKAGKTMALKNRYPDAIYMNLQNYVDVEMLQNTPELVRQNIINNKSEYVIIDEIDLLRQEKDNIKWLVENTKKYFILCGCNHRSLNVNEINMLGENFMSTELYPLSFIEIEDFNLVQALNRGLFPQAYNSKKYLELLTTYIQDYLQQEIRTDASVKSLHVFSSFLRKAAEYNTQTVTHVQMARELGVTGSAIKTYYNILQQTKMIKLVSAFAGNTAYPYVVSPKVYFTDMGIVNVLLSRKQIQTNKLLLDQYFKHFIYLELVKYIEYTDKKFEIYYWRTPTGLEVDFIIEKQKIVISTITDPENFFNKVKSIMALNKNYVTNKNILVSYEQTMIQHASTQVYYWSDFVSELWLDKIL
jgi:uncharacterized protein